MSLVPFSKSPLSAKPLILVWLPGSGKASINNGAGSCRDISAITELAHNKQPINTSPSFFSRGPKAAIVLGEADAIIMYSS